MHGCVDVYRDVVLVFVQSSEVWRGLGSFKTHILVLNEGSKGYFEKEDKK